MEKRKCAFCGGEITGDNSSWFLELSYTAKDKSRVRASQEFIICEGCYKQALTVAETIK